MSDEMKAPPMLIVGTVQPWTEEQRDKALRWFEESFAHRKGDGTMIVLGPTRHLYEDTQ